MNTSETLNQNINTSRNNNFEAIMVAIMMFFPMSSVFNLLRLGISLILFVLLFFTKVEIKIDARLTSLFSLMIFSLILPRIAVIICEGMQPSELWVHEIQRIGFCIILMYCVYNYKISFDFLFKICIITLLIHTGIQTLQFMGVESVSEFIQNYYLEEGESGIHLTLAQTENTASFRSGSIYMNPNVYMVIPLSVLAMVLQRQKLKSENINILFIAIAVYSLLLTGSRTTLIVAICMIAYYVLNSDSGGWRWIVFIYGAAGLIVILLLLGTSYRALNLQEGFSGSLGTKFELITEYILTVNPIYLLTGSLSSTEAVAMDSEWTHIFAFFGIIGIVWYIKFLKLLSRNQEKYPLIAKLIVLNVGLIAISASVLLCMPIFSFVCLVSLVEIE